MEANTSEVEKDDLENTKDKVIVGNNAQTIYDEIKGLENEPKHRQRWIWELLQNAQDTAEKSRVDVEITFDKNSVVFSHNGQSFTADDIAHLIFHGSSKLEKGKAGKFGTGFMTTHLLSKEVAIKGTLKDGRSFDFILDRTGNKAAEMAISLTKSWSNFKLSILNSNELWATTFTYNNLSLEGIDTVKDVLFSAHLVIPKILAFSKGLGTITINNEGIHERYERIDYSEKDLVKVKCIKDGVDSLHYLRIHSLSDMEGQIALPIDKDGNLMELNRSIPKLFITFPLISTELAFPLPFLIHHPSFEPTSDRKSLWLSSINTTDTNKNKEILSDAFKTYVELAKLLSKEKKKNLNLLADIGRFPNADWVDSVWYTQEMTTLMQQLDEIPLLTTIENETISLKEALVPSSEIRSDLIEAQSVWRLLEKLLPNQTPSQAEFELWRKIVIDRESFEENVKYPSAYTLQDLCRKIDSTEEKNIDNIQVKEITPLAFIADLIKEIEICGLHKWLNEFDILPNQYGYLNKYSALQQEAFQTVDEIGDTLKNIAKALIIPVKDILLHEDIKISVSNYQLKTLTKSIVVASLIQKVKSIPFEKISPTEEQASIDLLKWLLENDKLAELIGYPIKMDSGSWDKLQQNREPFLSPSQIWKPIFQKYKDLFLSDIIMADDYARVFTDKKVLAKATKSKLLLENPLYYEKDDLVSNDIAISATRRNEREQLSQKENLDWKLDTEILFSKIANLNTPKDKNIIDKSRSSIKRTKQFLEFIIDALIVEDLEGFTRKSIKVKDSNMALDIGIYPSKWLIELKKRDWIKDQGGNTSSKPSADAFLPYFKDKEGILYSSLQKTEVSRLLYFLGIGVGDLLRNIRSENEEIGMDWDQSYVSILMNDSLTPAKVTRLLSDPGFIKAYEEKEADENRRRENQVIGAIVEKKFVEAFESLSGFNIKREPIGSDYIIESDSPHQLLITNETQNKFLIEIKSTRSTEVKMTLTQGFVACKEKENYILCVVPLTNKEITPQVIMQNAKFVTNIAKILQKRVEKVKTLTALQDEVIQMVDPLGEIKASIEGTNIRYVINQKVWEFTGESVLTFDQFVKGFISTQSNNI